MSVTNEESSSLYSAAVEELVAIGAAIACNCEPCFKYHFREALAGEQLATAREAGPQPGSCCCATSPKTQKRR